MNPKYPRLSSGDTINRTLLQKVLHKWCFTVNEILGNQLINYLTCQSLQYTACHSHESEVSPLHAMNSKINTKGRVNNTSSFPVFVLVALFSPRIHSSSSIPFQYLLIHVSYVPVFVHPPLFYPSIHSV